jgi:hypothetical protein
MLALFHSGTLAGSTHSRKELAMTSLNTRAQGQRHFARLLCIGSLAAVVPGCGGGSSGGDLTAPDGGSGGGTATTMSCSGYPRAVSVSVNAAQQTYTQVCLIATKSAAVTPYRPESGT